MRLDPANLELVEYRGCLALVGPALDAAFNAFGTKRPSHPLHITLFTAAEWRTAQQRLARPSFPSLSLENIYAVGTGHRHGVSWIVVLWNHGNVFRRDLGLEVKDFHITLSDEDEHGIDKSLGSIPLSRDDILERIGAMGETALDHAFYSVKDLYLDLVSALSSCTCVDSRNPLSQSTWLRNSPSRIKATRDWHL